MKSVLYLILLPQLVTTGDIQAGCSGEGETLLCTFPQDVISTQIDFVVHFYPYDGGEEPLLDCAWVRSKINCIHQEGVAPQTPVSNTVAITIPKTFSNRNGSYKCVPEGFKHDSITECRFPSTEGSALTGSAVLVSHISVVMVSVSSATSAFLL